MTTVAPTSATPAAAPRATATLSSATAAEQQDRFMKLLVAQMKNQDPLNPMDNAQMTSQIAQINTVGGLEKLNRTVEGLVAAFQGMQFQSSLQLPGRDVLVEGGTLTLADGKAQGGVALDAKADAVAVEILGADGAVVQTLALGAQPAGVRSFTWDGQRADGTAAAPGAFRMRVVATAGGQPVGAAALAAARVHSVSTGDAGLQLDLGPAGMRGWGEVKSFL